MKDSSENEGGEPPEWNWEHALKTAILIGLSIEEFDYITPYELSICMESYMETKEEDLKERLTLIWLGEYYHRSKRLPNLQDELKKISGDSKKTMSDDEMLETVKMLNAQFGGTFIKGGE